MEQNFKSQLQLSQNQIQSSANKQTKKQQISLGSMNTNAFKTSCLIIIIASIIAFIHNTQSTQPFKPYINTTSRGSGIPLIFAGQIHYPRIPVEYWQHRIKMIKAMGLNSLSVYIMWNYHQIEKGKFDFQTQNRNMTLFLDLAIKYNMTVLIRPGPYICGQWDFGGLPARLLAIDGLKIRSNDQQFLKQTRIYFKVIADIIRPYIRSADNQKGPIIMLQIQNQYGFFGSDKSYVFALKDMWGELDINVDMYYVQWVINVGKAHWQGANIVQYDYVKTMQPRGRIFGGQIYSGWQTRWQQQKLQVQKLARVMGQYQYLLRNNHSFSMYMAHGGTNFGLSAGSNAIYDTQHKGFAGQITSYDYDAPINQQGSETEKYKKLRELISSYARWDVPEVPDPIPMIKIEKMQLVPIASLNENIQDFDFQVQDKFYRFESTKLKMFNQGIVIYETQLKAQSKYKINITIHDVAFVTINGQFDRILDRTQSMDYKDIEFQCKSKTPCQFRILIQAMGHINFDKQMQDDYKGLITFDASSKQNFRWKMYKLPINQKIFEWKVLKKDAKQNSTILMKTTFNLKQVGDTYFNMRNFYKGYVWVNGRNIGRYWNLGPQYKLFCPGVWLKQGENTIYVLQMKYFKQYEEVDGKKSEIKKTIKGQLTLSNMNQ